MGYRSSVAAAFYVKDAKHFPVLKLWLVANFPMEKLGECVRWFDRGMVFEEDWVKWYDDYDDVKAFNEVVEKFKGLIYMDASEDTPRYNYEFVRVGENYDDVDTEYDGDDCEFILGVSRAITCEV